jgi:hypothetical protein
MKWHYFIPSFGPLFSGEGTVDFATSPPFPHVISGMTIETIVHMTTFLLEDRHCVTIELNIRN